MLGLFVFIMVLFRNPLLLELIFGSDSEVVRIEENPYSG
jgi:hypothetical protein